MQILKVFVLVEEIGEDNMEGALPKLFIIIILIFSQNILRLDPLMQRTHGQRNYSRYYNTVQIRFCTTVPHYTRPGMWR